MGRLILVEFYKVIRQRKMLIMIIGLLAFALLLQIGFRYQTRNPLTHIARRADIDVDLVLNAINASRLIINATYHLFFPVMAALIFAGQLAGEKAQGTLRAMLSRPVSRIRLYSVKFLVSSLLMALTVLVFAGATTFFGWLLFGPHEFVSASRLVDLLGSGPSVVLPFAEGLKRLGLSTVVLAFVLLPTGALAFYFSVFCKNAQTAMATSLLVFFGVYVLQGLSETGVLSFFSIIEPYLFTSAMGSWKFIFMPEISWADLFPKLMIVLVYSATFFAAGMIHFRYLDMCD